MTPVTNTEFFLAGVKFRPNWQDFTIKGPLSDVDVRLFHEKGNKFDEFALKVFFNGTFVGYVPTKINKQLFADKSAGLVSRCDLIAFQPEAESHNRYRISVKMCHPDTPLTP